MSDRKTEVLDALDQAQQNLNNLFSHMQPSDWDRQIQDEDQMWTVRQILAHLVNAQRGMTNNITSINTGGGGAATDFDVHRWNKRMVEKSVDKTPQDLITELGTGHAALKTVIEGLDDADF